MYPRMLQFLKGIFKTPQKANFEPSKKSPEAGKLSGRRTQIVAREKPIDNTRLLYKLKRVYQYKMKSTIDELEQAIYSAEDPNYIDRTLLYSIYKDISKDGHLFSQMRTTRNKILAAPFILIDKKNGKPDEASKELLERPWLSDYLKYAVDSYWWGHSLVEFDEPTKGDAGNEFSKVSLFPREHVKQWEGTVVINPHDAASAGFYYREKPYSRWICEIGDPDNLGLLHIAAEDIIRKRFAKTDWSRHSEKFGMPIVAVTTQSRQEDELDAKEEWLESLGTNGYVILDDQDKVTFLESAKGSDVHKIYMEMIKLCNDEVSNIISGQTGTSDQKSFVGAAEVQERLFDEYIKSILRELQNHINFTLIPFMNSHGYPLQGKKLLFTDLIEQKPEPQDTPTKPTKKEPAPGGAAGKKQAPPR